MEEAAIDVVLNVVAPFRTMTLTAIHKVARKANADDDSIVSQYTFRFIWKQVVDNINVIQDALTH